MTKQIVVTKGVGSGETKLAAFDRALFQAGIANYNLMLLSSVIPRGWSTVVRQLDLNDREIGNKLYVVMAEQREQQIDREAWAGLGWVESNDSGGLFVEHHGASKEEVEKLIKHSLTSMMHYRESKFGPIQQEIVGIRCEGKPVCALVAAVYKSEDW